VTIGFNAVPALLTGKVAGATAFWNVEGVTLKRRGLATHEFRVDSFGAPRYPELVLVARHADVTGNPQPIRDTLAALAAGTRDALADRPAAVRRVAAAAQANPSLIAAELDAVAPALSPPMRLNAQALAGWADFDFRFGILRHVPLVREVFDTSLAP
jgi:NitT/TauT family transport system substrate-binding protein/putative hydroxymethylpyrimidine transport system substrate-binding protein